MLHKLLELATVAIAIPLYRERTKLKALAAPLILSICAATLVNLASVAVLALTLKLHAVSFASLMTKSVTTPVAIGISDLIGGNASLTAVIVISTGIIGAMFGPSLLQRIGITDPITTGIALGTVSHGVGTARAFQISAQAGAFAGLSMALCAIFTSLLLPKAFQVLFM
jgi:putative effector of murein hydrolase